MNYLLINTTQKIVLILIAGLTLLTTVMGTAHASRDAKNYPGSICQPMIMNNPFIKYSNSGAIYSTRVTRDTIYCPIIRDFPSNSNSGWDQVLIKYINPHPTLDIVCSIYARDRYGRPISYHHARLKSGNSYLVVNNQDNYISKNGVYTMSCSFPPRINASGYPQIFLIKFTESD